MGLIQEPATKADSPEQMRILDMSGILRLVDALSQRLRYNYDRTLAKEPKTCYNLDTMLKRCIIGISGMCGKSASKYA